ncbi:MAG: MATE family efflux transporter [Clostridia bacterium]|nr:MATE family efflux transporter [Clostridia bacterium]
MTGLVARVDRYLSSEQFTGRELRGMFWTLALDQFFIYAISMCSTALVSSVGEAAVAAVSMVSTLNGMVSLMFTSLASGGAIVVSRAKGRNDLNDLRSAIGEVIGLCGAMAIALSTLLIVFSEPLVRVIYPHVEPLLITYAVQYMRLVALSFIPYAVFNAVFNIFRSLGDTRSSLLLTVVINVAHLGLSILFINRLKLGVSGSGLSYITARCIGMALALLWLLRVHNVYHVRPASLVRFRRETTREIFSLGMPMTLEAMLMQGGMLLVQMYLSRLTTTDLAAHAVASSMLNLYHTTSGALSTMTGTICGQCWGAGRKTLAKDYCLKLIRAGRLVLLATALLLYPLTPLLLRFYSTAGEAARLVRTALLIGAVSLPLLWCDSYLPAMALRVAGDASFTAAVSVLALALGRCALGYVLTIPLGLGVPGIWIGMAAEWAVRGVVLRGRMRKGAMYNAE